MATLGYAELGRLFLEGHAFEVTALELLAGNFRRVLVEAREARAVEHPITCLRALSERLGSTKGGGIKTARPADEARPGLLRRPRRQHALV
jgi:hypothetical protein